MAKEIDFKDIEVMCMLVQIEGKAHQVLASRAENEIALRMLCTEGLRLTKPLQPIIFKELTDK